ncbi:unnamed protein product [Discosporangium mesarthrocarpum]
MGRSASGQLLTWHGPTRQQKPCQGRPYPQASHGGGGNYKKFIIDEVIPAVKAKMSRRLGHTIFVQQDGAKPHTKKGVMEAIQAAAGNGIILETQPSSSPYLNVNDLDFFHSIQ